MFNVFMLTLYWGIFHLAFINKFEGMQRVHMYLLHLFPGISFAANAHVSDYHLYHGHWKKLFLPLGILHAVISFTVTYYRGTPILKFLTWDSLTSPIVCICFQCAFSFIFIGMASRSRKGRFHVATGPLQPTRREVVKQKKKDKVKKPK